MLGAFEQTNTLRLRSLAHDLASPLSAIKLNLDLLSFGGADSKQIIKRMERGISVIQTLLEAETGAGGSEQVTRTTRNPRQIKASEVIRSVGSDNALLAEIVGVKIIVRIQADKAVNKPESLYRVLNNLVRNSIQALKEIPDSTAGIIKIYTASVAGKLQITLQDNGPGIPPKLAGQLGKRLVASEKQGGHGLGLYGAAKLLKADCGGYFVCENNKTGQCGASFRILI